MKSHHLQKAIINIGNGGRTALCSGLSYLFQEFSIVRPTIVSSPPIVFTTLHAQYQTQLAQQQQQQQQLTHTHNDTHTYIHTYTHAQ